MPQLASTLNEDTDRHAAIHLKHISPTWVLFLDWIVGFFRRHNGGYCQFTVIMERGKVRYFDINHRYVPENWHGSWWREESEGNSQTAKQQGRP